ncbi:MAG: PQQ-binding-like beta-propeller repeat protein, partial [Planctomycetota bacterium]
STKNAVLVLLFLVASNVCAANAAAEDWLRFRGENGSGLIAEKRNLPMKWDRESKENIKWAIDLPGPGHSSPIIVGDRVLLTCWTGYGTGVEGEDDQAKLARHLLCYHRETGKELWRRSVAAVLPEDRYEGMFAEHGYATHTPVSDGKHVFVFFGKSGVHAFELESGEPLWQQFVGNGLDPRRWGSAGSPILHKTKGDDSKQLVIVPAIAESTMLALIESASIPSAYQRSLPLSGFDQRQRRASSGRDLFAGGTQWRHRRGALGRQGTIEGQRCVVAGEPSRPNRIARCFWQTAVLDEWWRHQLPGYQHG